MSKQRTIEYFFKLHSPWAFLGHARLLDLARRHDAALVYRPMSLGEVFPASGGLPLAQRHPNRQAYRSVELQRWKVRLGLSFNIKPAFWPIDITHADRAVVALVALGHEPEPFVSRAFAALWQEDRDLADHKVIAGLLVDCGHDAAVVLAQAGSGASGEQYRANGNEALAAGVFGSPTYMLDGEPFWGQDRLDSLDEALTSGRAPIRP
ncbi:2-hydroxychromene-2-carboxylate isomerase [Lichenihabitans sp. PAMC28606]|uniref:2-hydroxychromene-2-carboxylate isomerase n=1 Tax=Lichenihabitans sp. PAMC28606 TaxID=2880932 RepID=UPI001D0B18EB|nr:2-hydroxychromene-2-carboxylate isomerase [Lichenihabitans sp. PAMC28606]UDL95940.1 2-hydroxychromene-2-carboxylate isomerase [Lichenihabitans sp. PAMC28606]